MNRTPIEVCCAIILYEGKVLIAQRLAEGLLPLKWEFPGGKVEENESEEACIHREIAEELAMNFKIEAKLTRVTHHYEDFSLHLIPFLGTVLSPVYEKNSHAKVYWASPEELSSFDWAAADLPIVEELLTMNVLQRYS